MRGHEACCKHLRRFAPTNYPPYVTRPTAGPRTVQPLTESRGGQTNTSYKMADESLGYPLSSFGLWAILCRPAGCRAILCRPAGLGCCPSSLASASSAPQGRSTSGPLVALPRDCGLGGRPAGAIDKSPPFQRWVPVANDIRKPRRGDRKQATRGASFHRVWSQSATGYRPHPLYLCATKFRGCGMGFRRAWSV